MAAFKDSVLKQIVADLNIQNEATIPAPLTEALCTLTNPVADATGGGVTNTRATLTIPVGDENYPAGSMTVHYRRLELATLFAGLPTALEFKGVDVQSKTLQEVLAEYAPALATYLLPELVDEGPYDLTRVSADLVLRPKANSLVLVPGNVTISALTAPVDLANFTSKENIPVFAFNEPLPAYGADLEAHILTRLLAINGETEPLSSADASITILPNPDLNTTSVKRHIRVTVTTPDLYYTGTADFSYNLMALSQAVDANVTQPELQYTLGQTQSDVIGASLQAQNKYFTPQEIVAGMPIKAVRAADYNENNDATHVWPAADSLIYGTAFQNRPLLFKFVTTSLFPFEEVIEFTVAVAGQKKVLTTTNTGTMPVTIELLEKPGAFAPSTLDVNASFITTQSLPVGTYKIRITRPDSYRTALVHHQFANGDVTEIAPVRVFSVKGHTLTNLFQFCPSLVTVDPTAFAEATYTYTADHLFNGCSGLEGLPDGVFNQMLGCYNWSFVLAGTTALSVVPDALFGFVKAYKPNFTSVLSGSGAQVLPTNFFQNIGYIDLNNVFQAWSGLLTIEPGFMAAMNLKEYIANYSQMFGNCWRLTAIPADFFVGAQAPTDTSTSAYNGDWRLLGTFKGCSALTTLPATLFQPLIALGLDNFNLTDAFSDCTGLVDIPQGLFDGVSFPGVEGFGIMGLSGTFYGCTDLTTLRGDTFHNCTLNRAFGMGSDGGIASKGAFENTGLTAIPADLFLGNESVDSLQRVFAGTQITAIPAGLLDGLTALKDVRMLFLNCFALTTVPNDLFASQAALTHAEGLFRSCSALENLPAGLFTPLTGLVSAPYCFWDAGVTAIPIGLLGTCAQLQTVEGFFLNCPITGPVDNLFTNQPVLTDVSYALSGTQITEAGANLLAGAPEITDVRALFSSCKQLTTVAVGLFDNQTKIIEADQLFSNTDVLATVPGTLLATNPLITTVYAMFSNAIGLTTLPANLLAAQENVTTVANFAYRCAALQAIPAGFFDGLFSVQRWDACFEGCSLIPAVPNGLFAAGTSPALSFDNAFKGCSALTTIGTGLFGNNANPVTLEGIFRDCTSLLEVPDGIFFNLTNIASLRFAFQNCYGLTTVGRLVNNTQSVKIEIGGFLGGDLTGTGPATFPDFAVADNLIASSIPVDIGAYGYTKPFNRRNNWTKNITNLFDPQVRIPLDTNQKGYFADMPGLTGSGQTFITKHSVPSTMVGFFKNSTGLSDYATLPAWAKT